MNLHRGIIGIKNYTNLTASLTHKIRVNFFTTPFYCVVEQFWLKVETGGRRRSLLIPFPVRKASSCEHSHRKPQTH